MPYNRKEEKMPFYFCEISLMQTAEVFEYRVYTEPATTRNLEGWIPSYFFDLVKKVYIYYSQKKENNYGK